MQITKATEMSKTKNFRICLYGEPGIGKTYSHRYLQGKTLILDMDASTKTLAGVDDIDIVEFDQTNPEESIIEFLKWLPTVVDQYDNLVLENLSAWEKAWFNIKAKEESKSGLQLEVQHYQRWGMYFVRVLVAIYKFDINVISTAWQKSKEINLPSGQIINQYQPDLRDSVMNTFLGLTDLVGRIQMGEKGRGVLMQGNDGILAKNRLDTRKGAPIEELYIFGDDNVPTS